ncbi:MAG: glutamate--cysteine ligase [Bacteroidetes bacterium]|nr:glutamate--cysteine ligase [Bacteroidota bacterium]
MGILRLFEGFGVELEYMIVDRTTLEIKPIAHELLRDADGEVVAEIDKGPVAWCNELVAHVIELKTNGPASSLTDLASLFAREIAEINRLLEPHHACLMPTAMHPWMDPLTQTVIWEHEYNEVYEAFNAIFDCRGHGWSNLQSTHLNLPFSNDEEFGRLHAAIRAILPLLPALSASSPVMEGRITGILDNRLDVYKTNALRVPEVSGMVVPEPMFSRYEYEHILLGSIYEAIKPFDTKGILQEEWLNARGAIARFDRNAIEIRVLDVQECPAMDLAILQAIVSVIKLLCMPGDTPQAGDMLKQDDSSGDELQRKLRQLSTEKLAYVLNEVILTGGDTVISDAAYIRALGLHEKTGLTVYDVWRMLLSKASSSGFALADDQAAHLEIIFKHGNLSQRLLNALRRQPNGKTLASVYRRLVECLHGNQPFLPESPP